MTTRGIHMKKILKLLYEKPRSFEEILKCTGLKEPNLVRLMSRLVNHNWVSFRRSDKTYALNEWTCVIWQEMSGLR